MAHTPGPWTVREPEDGEQHEIYAENGGDLICYPVWTANQQANVPLIAAAPDLLDVCQKILAWQSEDDPYSCDDWMEFATDLGAQAGRAIAKAEGRSE